MAPIQPNKSMVIFFSSALFLLALASIVYKELLPSEPSIINQTDRRSLQSLPDTSSEENAIAALVEDNDADLESFCLALKSLSKNAIVKKETPLLIFHEYDFPERQKFEIMKCTNYPISYLSINFTFPEGFNPFAEYKQTFRVAPPIIDARDLWRPYLITRFWTTELWKHKAIQPYKTIMRLNTDACFIEPSKEEDSEDVLLAGMRGRYLYRTDHIGVGKSTYIQELYDFAVDYMKKEKITPTHSDLWALVKYTWEKKKTLPIFGTHFEIHRVNFVRRPPVMKWLDALTEKEPFGVFREGWGEEFTRVLTMAMFADKDDESDSVLIQGHPGFRHGKGICADYFEWNTLW